MGEHGGASGNTRNHGRLPINSQLENSLTISIGGLSTRSGEEIPMLYTGNPHQVADVPGRVATVLTRGGTATQLEMQLQ